MKTKSRMIALLLIAAAGSATQVKADQASNVKIVSVPATAKINTDVKLVGVVQDVWDNSGLPGRIVNIGVGECYYSSSTSFNSIGNGTFSRT